MSGTADVNRRVGHFPALEAVRGLAALAILVYHSAGLSGDGTGFGARVTDRFWLGVPLFFVLSGFLLYRPFARATLSGARWPSLRRYGRARILRIAPAYVVALTVAILLVRASLTAAAITFVVLVLWVRAIRHGRAKVVPVIATALLIVVWASTSDPTRVAWVGLVNYLLVFRSFGLDGAIGPAWSLCVEVAFYAALPLIAFGIHRVALGRRLVAVLLIASLVPVGIVYVSFSGWDRPLPDLLPGYLQLFAMGMLLALAAEMWPPISTRSGNALLLFGLVVLTAGQALYGLGPESLHANGASVGYAPAMAAAFALILASIVLPESSALERVLTTRPLIALGVISYGVFLWHFIVIETLDRTPLWTSHELANTLLTLGPTLLAATVSWRLVERRALARKDRPLWGTRSNSVARLRVRGLIPRPGRRQALADLIETFERVRTVQARLVPQIAKAPD